jgi:hypothetical protein
MPMFVRDLCRCSQSFGHLRTKLGVAKLVLRHPEHDGRMVQGCAGFHQLPNAKVYVAFRHFGRFGKAEWGGARRCWAGRCTRPPTASGFARGHRWVGWHGATSPLCGD